MEQGMSEEAAPEAIRFTAIVYKVQTLVDGGVRVTLDLVDAKPETVLELIQARQPGILLETAAVPFENE
jgi:hypothetical protein